MKRRTVRRDPVTHDVALAVLRRDGGCVAVTLGESPADCSGRLTLDHVKDQPRMGKRAPSDEAHLVSLCEGHHLWSGWATSHRPELREYLRGLNRRCIWQPCVATWQHWHGGFPGGYDNPDDPTGPPIPFEGDDPDPNAVRDYNGAVLA